MNSMVSGRNQGAFTAVALTVLNGDGGGATNTSRGNYNGQAHGAAAAATACTGASTTVAAITAFPGAQAQIHLEGANYGYADGHVKWLRSNSTTGSSAVTPCNNSHAVSAGRSTFSIE
jgi:prepilin-type processing-associated H-X9-DG protein